MMSNGEKLPLWENVIGSYGFVWKHRRDLMRIGWLPLLLVFLSALYFGSFDLVHSLETDLADSGPIILKGLAGALLQGAISVLVLVSWHRLVMRDYGPAGESAAQASKGALGRRGGVYFLQMLLLSIIFLVVWLAAFFIAEILFVFGYLLVAGEGARHAATSNLSDVAAIQKDPAFVIIGYGALLVALLPAFYASMRLSLTLPETATADAAGRFSHSWTASAGNGWRMVFATVFVMLPVEAFNLATGFLASANAGNALHYPLVLLASAGLVVLMALLGTVLSRCYAFLQYGPAKHAGAPAASVVA